MLIGTKTIYYVPSSKGVHDVIETVSERFPGHVYQWARKFHEPKNGQIPYACTGCNAKKPASENLKAKIIRKGQRVMTNPDFPATAHLCQPRLQTHVIAKRLRGQIFQKMREQSEGKPEMNRVEMDKLLEKTRVSVLTDNEDFKRINENEKAVISEAMLQKANLAMYKASQRWLAVARKKRELKDDTSSPRAVKRHRASSANGEASFPFRTLASYQGQPSVILTISTSQPGYGYEWKRLISINATLFGCYRCTRQRQKTGEGQEPLLRLIDGRLVGDPNNPNRPHLCQPLRLVDILTKRLRLELMSIARKTTKKDEVFSRTPLYDEFVSAISTRGEVQDLAKDELNEIMTRFRAKHFQESFQRHLRAYRPVTAQSEREAEEGAEMEANESGCEQSVAVKDFVPADYFVNPALDFGECIFMHNWDASRQC